MVQAVDGHIVEYALSARGKIQLIIDDFQFCQNEVLKKKTYYVCCQTRALGYVTLELFNLSNAFSM